MPAVRKRRLSHLRRELRPAVELALVAAGGAGFFKIMRLERAFRDVQGARLHPLTDGQQQTLAGRMALGRPIDG